MGGNLFKGTRRHTTKEIDKLEMEIVDICDKFNLRHKFIQSMTEKADHGDYDLIVCRNDVTVETVKYMFDNYEVAINGKYPSFESFFKEHFNGNSNKLEKIDVLSFKLYELQVDFIMIEEDSIDFASYYHSFNDLGGIIGSSIRPMGVFLGREGLYTKYYPRENGEWYKVYLTKDWTKFAEVFDIDTSVYHSDHIRNLDGLYAYLKDFKYFNSTYMSPEFMNATRRNRAAKRSTFQYIANKAKDEGEIKNYSVDEIDIKRLLSQFDSESIEEQKRNAKEMSDYEVAVKTSFSLDRMKNVLGYTPENANQIFKSISNANGGPLEVRKKTYLMSDEEFKRLIEEYL